MQDPHGELKNQNVLIIHGSVEETAAEFGLSEEECEEVLQKGRELLFEERKNRPRPHLDDKMVTAWNGKIIILCLLYCQINTFFYIFLI